MAHDADVQGLLSELLVLGHTLKPPPTLGTQQAFDWVADCAAWLCQRAAPDLSVPRDYSSEAKRVAFLTALASQLYSRTRIRLNLSRLYRAGGGAVRELRRLAAALSAAASTSGAASTHADLPTLPELDRPGIKQVSQSIAASAAQLVAALAAAPAAAAATRTALAAATDVEGMKAELQAALAAAQKQRAALEPAVAALGQEVAVLESRVEKRHVELDRLERRLDSLQTVRPAFSAEAEELEAELAGLYTQYLHGFRNLEWLEGSLDAYAAERQAEAEEADKQLRRIQRQMAAEELRLLQGDSQNGSPNTQANLAHAADFDSDDSEAGDLMMLKALPRLGYGGSGIGGNGNGKLHAAGAGSPPARSAAALDLQLLPEEESGAGSRGGTGTPKSRLGTAASAAGSAGGLGSPGMQLEGSRVGLGGPASLITAPRSMPPPAAVTVPRPGSARRAATGSSASNLLRAKAGGEGGGGGGGGPDVLTVDGGPGSSGGSSPLATPQPRCSNLHGDDF